MFERQKLLDELKKTESLFPDYLKNFTAFRLKHEENHRKAVRKEFNKAFQISKLKNRIKWLNYLLNS